ncbi:NAD(P)H-hydrate epimerase [Litoreibacter halocynthiae]|uniref:NAD(P)H-hydrate epimerase n=1 Tax=Litoreibacter halocynthiae TaxID=1242689 RepID=UPI0013C2AA70
MKTTGQSVVITSDEMRTVEQEAIASGRVTGLELMERAGRSVVEAIFEEWPRFRDGTHRAVVLCGPGNNGGDGFVVARLLKEAGWDVQLFLFGDATALPPDAATNFERWFAMGEVADIEQALHVDFDTCDLVVDALFGIGLSRPITAPVLRDLFKAVSQADKPARVAIDVPSGLDSDTGVPPDGGSALRADLTVTFHAFKPCHKMKSWPGVLPDSAALARYTVVKDIGL